MILDYILFSFIVTFLLYIVGWRIEHKNFEDSFLFRDPRPITDGVVIDRLVRVKIQITELFSMAVMITKEAESVSFLYTSFWR